MLVPPRSSCFSMTLYAFLTGVSLHLIILTFLSWQHYRDHQTLPVYDHLSTSFHPTYLSLYYSMFVAIIISFWKEFSSQQKILCFLLLWLAVFFMFLSGSRSAFLDMACLLIFMFPLLKMSTMQRISAGVFFLIFCLVMSYLLYQHSPTFKARINDLTAGYANTDCSTSSGKRKCLWKAAWKVIQQYPLGTAPANVHSKLNEEFARQQWTWAQEANLNCHNQYLETTVALGIPGLLMLIGILALGFYHAACARKMLFLFFLCIMTLNFIFESILETQAGISFFTSFYLAFYSAEPTKIKTL